VLDEARIESGVCSSNWIWASWATVASNSTLQNYSSVTQQPPALTIGSGVGNGTLLSWPGSGVGFVLYTATNLVPPVAWTLATSQPVLTNTQWQITLPVDSNTGFFRLQSQ
jgi:formylmethanofuran dehydrogenase subunit A